MPVDASENMIIQSLAEGAVSSHPPEERGPRGCPDGRVHDRGARGSKIVQAQPDDAQDLASASERRANRADGE
jgi:hypothetical protein